MGTQRNKRKNTQYERLYRMPYSPPNSFMSWRMALVMLYSDCNFITRYEDSGFLVVKTTGFRKYINTQARDVQHALHALKANGIIESFDWQRDYFTCKFNKPQLFFPQSNKLNMEIFGTFNPPPNQDMENTTEEKEDEIHVKE